MIRRWILGAALLVASVAAIPSEASAGDPPLPREFYYPYVYFPHNYWPNYSPKWPESPGTPYQRPPAYMAYPPFKEPGWRYELWEPKRFYRGNHFWLDAF